MTDLGFLLARHGYHAVALDRTARGGGDTYVSRLLGRRTVVIGEAEGAAAFYDESLASRAGAVPPPLAWLLFGRGAVHGLDGTAHRDRKRLFLDVLDPETFEPLLDDVRKELGSRSAGWPGRAVDLHDELVTTYGAAVLRWAGCELSPGRSDLVSRRLAEIVDGFGFAGPAYVRGWRSRRWADRWARKAVADVRAGRTHPAPGTALRRIADSDLPDQVAAVELLNVLRPTVAVAWLGTFVAPALASVPGEQRPLLRSESGARERFAFAQEVRRTSPFVHLFEGINPLEGGLSTRKWLRSEFVRRMSVVGRAFRSDQFRCPQIFPTACGKLFARCGQLWTARPQVPFGTRVSGQPCAARPTLSSGRAPFIDLEEHKG